MISQIINLTGHDVRVHNKELPGPIVIPSRGILRARYTTLKMGNLDCEEGLVPITKNSYYRIVGMPDPKPGVYYLVSRLVAELYPERGDLLITNGLIKEGGKTIACRSLGKI